jgi:hypothetical protein
MVRDMQSKLIAPCGMNCNLCIAYIRERNKCPGCRLINTHKPITRVKCKIKNCNILNKNKLKFCSVKCKDYPCIRLRKLDKRYRTKYGMSMLDNLNNIEKNGIKNFIRQEEKRWIKNNKIFCVHNKKYFNMK